ncbi:hypothetical protein G6011_06284 [Alternaria panax]|uniref:Uncharacterized protein n=1 Tax=Alternaria panax TaxID=48097 RepID=A0AAD4I9B2_9PLEO|nr:hypothetical protein G6011_06284 [Alternaria panax]
MATNIIYVVLRCQLHLRTAQQKQDGGKHKKPRFSWAEKIAQNESFPQPFRLGRTYDDVELETTDGSRWKTKLVHSTSCEEDVRISGHSPIKDVALQYRAEEARKHIDELKEAEIKVTEAPKSLWHEAESNDNMLDSIFYVVHKPVTLDDGTRSTMTRYWWDVVAVDLAIQANDVGAR